MQSEFSSKFIVSGEVQYLPGSFTELEKLLIEAKNENKKLRVKLGIDPTSTDLHLGHTVCLHYLRRFQELGHTPVLIIGGFTAMVGDPSGRNEARPPLTYEQVQSNAKTYLSQVSKILDTSPSKFEVVNNYDWLGKLSSSEILKLAHLVTINQLIGKEAFGNRIDKGEPLYLHEVLYPILQGYDSVAVKADIELGGIDQTYNVLFGRHMQKHFKQKEQLAIFLPLLIGLDGSKKMSKSFGNYIALNDSPGEVFGKSMSIPDELIIHYFKLVSDLKAEQIFNCEEELKAGRNPRDIKMDLAYNLVKQLHSKEAADEAKEGFIKQFQKSEIPDDIDEYKLIESIKVTDLMLNANLVPSKGEAKRLIDGGGVKLQSVKVDDPNFLITSDHKNAVLQIGKRKFVKII
jgi:tyrosyl-tRNA synthetase